MKQFFIKLYRKYKTVTAPKPVYPCKECFLVLSGAGCTDVCDKIEMDKNKLLEHVSLHLNCPDCGHDKHYRGPSGGMSVNIQCCSCKHWFNNSLPLAYERIRL